MNALLVIFVITWSLPDENIALLFESNRSAQLTAIANNLRITVGLIRGAQELIEPEKSKIITLLRADRDLLQENYDRIFNSDPRLTGKSLLK